MYISRKLSNQSIQSANRCYSSGIIPDYLSVKRQSMSGYEIYQSGDCEPFFNASKVFACATDSHYGNQADVFDRFYRYWQAAQKFF